MPAVMTYSRDQLREIIIDTLEQIAPEADFEDLEDDEDMREALETGKVAGYATDVWYQDPPEDSPLIDAPNMLMTPHIGASTAENLGRIGDQIVALVAKFVAENETTFVASVDG